MEEEKRSHLFPPLFFPYNSRTIGASFLKFYDAFHDRSPALCGLDKKRLKQNIQQRKCLNRCQIQTIARQHEGWAECWK